MESVPSKGSIEQLLGQILFLVCSKEEAKFLHSLYFFISLKGVLVLENVVFPKSKKKKSNSFIWRDVEVDPLELSLCILIFYFRTLSMA